MAITVAGAMLQVLREVEEMMVLLPQVARAEEAVPGQMAEMPVELQAAQQEQEAQLKQAQTETELQIKTEVLRPVQVVME